MDVSGLSQANNMNIKFYPWCKQHGNRISSSTQVASHLCVLSPPPSPPPPPLGILLFHPCIHPGICLSDKVHSVIYNLPLLINKYKIM